MYKETSRIALAAALSIATAPLAFAQTAETTPAVQGEEIIVTGQRGAINRARAAERDAASLSNVITADSIGEFPDQNVAESVRRVPGVNVSRNEGEGRTISVRGLPPSFTTVTVNGARVGSVDAGTGEVQLDSVGSELLDQITVVKAITPDMDGDAIGGSVELSSLSALTRGENSLTLGASGYYNDYSENITPEHSVSFTRLLLNGDLGVAGSVSYSERDVTGYEVFNEAGLRPYSEIQPSLGLQGLRLGEIDNRAEIGTRERLGATLNIEWRPDDRNFLFFRTQYTQLDDDDGRYTDEYETDQADRIDELNQGPIGPNRAFWGARPNNATGGPDIDKQTRLSIFEDSVLAMSLGSEHSVDDDWTVGWRLDYSMARAENPEGYRSRFRIRNVGLDTTFGADGFDLRPVAAGTRDPLDPTDYTFDSLLIFDFEREDEIYTLSGDVRRDFSMFGRDAFIEVGARVRARDKFNDANQKSVDPSSSAFNAVPGIAGVRSTLAGVPTFTINSTIDPMILQVERNALWRLMRNTANLLGPLTPQQPVESFNQDFSVEEDTSAFYIMSQVELTPDLRIIGGVRVEDTDLASQGYFIELDDGAPLPGSGGVADLGFVTTNFTEALPSLHLLWNPRANIDVRASYNRGLQRPNFDDFANRLNVSVDGSDADVDAGNPYLRPLTADNFDLAIGWYPNRNTALQAGVFYKRIENFFVEYDGAYNFPGNPLRLPGIARTDIYTPQNLEIVLNGEEATLVGVEVGYSQAYTFLPGFFGGFFTQANVTWIDSEAEAPFLRPGETFTLPDQPDLLANLSLGWENDAVTVRLAGNYVGESLQSLSDRQLGGVYYEDTLREEYVSVDFTARVRVNETVLVTFDATNLNEANDETVYRGTPQTGRLFEVIEDYGRTYTLGVRARF